MEYKKLEINEKINFIRKTEMYGVAYFQFCFEINKKENIEKVFISPSQQPGKNHGWVIEVEVSTGWIIEVGKNINLQPIWHNVHGRYCTEHKSIGILIACPEGTTQLSCDHIGGDVWFKFE